MNSFKAHNFLEAQPVFPGEIDIFILRQILHDWPDKYASKILQHLRSSASPNTRLVIIDSLLRFACGDKDTAASEIKGALEGDPPRPLLENLGQANAMVYDVDIGVRHIKACFYQLE